MIEFTIIQKKLFGTWQFGKFDVLVNFMIQKFATFFSVFLVRGKYERRAFILKKIHASVVERQ